MDSTPADTPFARYIRTHRDTTPPTDDEQAARTRQWWSSSRLAVIPGLTQAELAARVGCSPAAVACWEQGTRRPGAAHLFTLAEIFQVDYLELLDRIRYPDRYPNDDTEAVAS